jgi:hypothetical protein
MIRESSNDAVECCRNKSVHLHQDSTNRGRVLSPGMLLQRAAVQQAAGFYVQSLDHSRGRRQLCRLNACGPLSVQLRSAIHTCTRVSMGAHAAVSIRLGGNGWGM